APSRPSQGGAGRGDLALAGGPARVERPRAPLAPDRPEFRLGASARDRRAGSHLPRRRTWLRLRGRAGTPRYRNPGRGPFRGLPPEGPGLLREVLRPGARRLRAAERMGVRASRALPRADRLLARGGLARMLRDGVD